MTSKFPFLGSYQFYTVMSGSMAPQLKTGSLILVEKKAGYHVGDIVTFTVSNSKDTVTHRITSFDQLTNTFKVRGDANISDDFEPVPASSIVGKMVLSVPLVGFPIAFSRTQVGLIVLIIIPATIIIYSELINIKNESIRLIRERRKRKLTPLEQAEVTVGRTVTGAEDEVIKIKTEIKEKAVSAEKSLKHRKPKSRQKRKNK